MDVQGITTSGVPQWTAADRLRKARVTAGLTQTELAEQMGVAKSTVSNYEAGHTTNLRTIVLKQWALATGVPVAWLRYGEEGSGGTFTPGGQEVRGTGCIADVVMFPGRFLAAA